MPTSSSAGASAKRSAPNGGKDKSAAAPNPNPVIYHGSVLLRNLPVNYRKVYQHTVRRFFSPAQQAHLGKGVRLIEEIGNATLCVEVDSKESAQLLFQKLQNRKVYGRRWKVQYVPTEATTCSTDACLVDCYLIPAASQHLAERALTGIPGFLSFVETPDEPLPASAAATVANASPIQDADNDSDVDGVGEDEANPYRGQQRHKLLVSFADEGSAIHARAVLSGRLVGTSGVRMFLERRRGTTQ